MELALHQRLRQHALSQYRGKLQLVLQRYSEALLIIPRTLARSCASASQSEGILARLKLIHAQDAQGEFHGMFHGKEKKQQKQNEQVDEQALVKEKSTGKYFGVDVLAKRPVCTSDTRGTYSVTDLQQHAYTYRCSDMVQRGVLENAESKVSMIQLATHAAILLLRINGEIYIQ